MLFFSSCFLFSTLPGQCAVVPKQLPALSTRSWLSTELQEEVLRPHKGHLLKEAMGIYYNDLPGDHKCNPQASIWLLDHPRGYLLSGRELQESWWGTRNWEIIFLAIVFSLAKYLPHSHFLARLESYFLLWGEQYELIQVMKFSPQFRMGFIFSNWSLVFLFMKTI